MQNFIEILFFILQAAIIARALLSWFNPREDFLLARLLYDITEPILGPLRRVIPRVGMLDLTPLVAIIVLNLIGHALAEVVKNVA